MQLVLKFREQYSVPVREEFDQLVASLNAQVPASISSAVGASPPSSSGGGGGGGGGSVPGMDLDYLGNYVAGPVYNDGDIVIGPDGIAYLCVVDGTATAPEPWPGVGVPVNAAVDASYWVVDGHVALTNARVMSSLDNGYVKSTYGEPDTIAIIPVADGGTGASTPATARVNLGIGTVGPINLNGNASTFLNGAGTWSVPPSTGVVSGSVILFTTPCPPGYTRLAALDGRFVRLANDNLSGGAASHQHGIGSYAMPAHTHAAGTYAAANHNHGVGSFGVAAHNHGISGQTSSVGDHQHAVSGNTNVASTGQFNADNGSSGNVNYAPHTHAIAFTSGAGGGHAHDLPNTDNASPGLTGNSQSTAPAVTGVSASTGPTAITGASDVQSNNPLYIDLYACQKD